jgi:hypothetical protein
MVEGGGAIGKTDTKHIRRVHEHTRSFPRGVALQLGESQAQASEFGTRQSQNVLSLLGKVRARSLLCATGETVARARRRRLERENSCGGLLVSVFKQRG